MQVRNYTVQDALDSGSAFLSNGRNGTELGLTPAFVAQFNLQGNGIMNPTVLKSISHAEWQDFEKAHLLYLAASMAARAKVRLSENDLKNVAVTLADFLREARPAGANILVQVLIFLQALTA